MVLAETPTFKRKVAPARCQRYMVGRSAFKTLEYLHVPRENDRRIEGWHVRMPCLALFSESTYSCEKDRCLLVRITSPSAHRIRKDDKAQTSRVLYPPVHGSPGLPAIASHLLTLLCALEEQGCRGVPLHLHLGHRLEERVRIQLLLLQEKGGAC